MSSFRLFFFLGGGGGGGFFFRGGGGGGGGFVTYGNVEGRKVKMNWKLNLLGLVNLGCRA